MSGALRNDGFFDDIDQDGFWSDVPKAPAQKTIGQMRAEAGPVQDWKAPAAPLGRTGDGGIADVFASFMQHFQGTDEASSNSQGITSNLLRTQMGTTPILDQRQADTIRAYEESTPFWKEPSLAEKVAGGLGAGAGTLTGAARDPLGLIGGVGKTLASTFLQNTALGTVGDSLSQLFTKDLPTQYNPNAEVYNPQTQEFEANEGAGPAYVAPGFDITRAVGSGVASGTAATVLSGQAFKAIADAIESVATADRSLFDNFVSGLSELRVKGGGVPGAAPAPGVAPAPDVDPFAALPDNVKQILAANGITPDDPRLGEVISKVQERLAGNAARVSAAPPTPQLQNPAELELRAQRAREQLEAVKGAGNNERITEAQREVSIAESLLSDFRRSLQDPETARQSLEMELAADQRLKESLETGIDPETGGPFNPGFDPRVGAPKTSLLPPTIALGQSRPLANGTQGTIARGGVDDALTQTGRSAVAGMDAAGLKPLTREEKMAVLDRYGYVPDNMEQARRLYTDMGGERSARGARTAQTAESIILDSPGTQGSPRAFGEPASTDPGVRASFDQQRNEGVLDVTPAQADELRAAWGFVPDTAKTRLKAYESLKAEKARQGEADAKGVMRVSDTSGEGRTSPASRPMDRGNAEDDTGAYERTGKGEPPGMAAPVVPRNQSSSGRGDRPFRADDSGTGNEGSGNVEFDLMRAAREGNPEAGFRERTKAEEFEAKARADYESARKQSEEDLQRFWDYRRQQRERDSGERQRQEQRQERAQQQHSGKASSSKEKGFDTDGRFEVDENGFVMSDKGGPIVFGDQKQAAKWILKAQRESLDQNFEIHNHPTKPNSFTAREFSRTSKSGTGGRTGADTGSDAGAKSAGTEQNNRSESQSGAGDARASEGVSDDGGTAGPRGEADNARESAQGASGETRPLSIEQRRVPETDARRKAQAAEAELKALREDIDRLEEELKAAKAASKADSTPKGEKGVTAEAASARLNAAYADLDNAKYRLGEAAQTVKNVEDSLVSIESGRDSNKAKLEALEAKKRKTAKDKENIEIARNNLSKSEHLLHKYKKELPHAKDNLEAARADVKAKEAALEEAKVKYAPERYADPAAAGNEKLTKAKAARDAKAEELKKLKAEAAEADKKAAADFKEEGKPKPGIPEGAKNTNAPVVESFFGFDKRPISKDDLTEDGYPKAFGEPDLKPQAKSGNKTTKFYSNPFGDPDIWKPIIKDLVAMVGSVRKGLGQLRQYLRNTTAFAAYTKLEDFVRYGLYSNAGFARTFIDRYRGMGKEDIAKGLDALFSKMYTRPGEGGKTGITRESWAEAVEPVVNQWANRVGNVLEPIAKLGDAALKKFADDYQYRGVMSPEHAKIAASLRKIMDEFRADMNKRLKAIADERIKSARTPEERRAMEVEAANLQIGFIKNYLPRMLDMEKLIASGGEEKFLAAATREYMRQYNLSKFDAERAAKEYYNNATGTSFVSHIGNTTRADTMKTRVFEARKDSALNEFYVDNPVESVYSYMLNTIRSVAHMERFGVNNEVLDRELTRLTELGLEKHDRDYLASAFNSSMGNIKTTLPLAVEQVAGMARMYGAVRFLDQSTLSSLMEPLAVAARSGQVMDAVKAMYLTVRQLAKKGDAEELRMFTEALGITTSAFNDAMMANKFMGSDLTARWQRRLSMNFFKQIGLTQLTQATRQASTQLGTYFIVKQLRNFSTGRAKESARQALAELGIEEKMVKPIMDMLGDNDGLPPVSKIMGDTPEAKAFRTAITRFVNESIMNPTASDRPAWASSSVGSLMYGIASFQAAFTRNVLFRTAKQVGGAVGGVARGEMGAMDVYNRAIGPLIGLGMLSYAQGMAGYLRDQINNPEQAAQRTDEQNALLMFSRAGLFGNLDKFINGVYGVKYGQDIKNIFVGPVISTLFRDATNIGKAAIDDNANTNTDEWKATKSAYEATVPFLIGGMVSAAASAPIPVRAGLGIWLLSPLSPGAPQTAVEVANAVAGPRQNRQFKDGEEKEGSGAFSEMPSLISGANAAEVPPPAKAARKRKYVISRDADGNLIAGTGNSTYLIKRDKSGRIEVEER